MNAKGSLCARAEGGSDLEFARTILGENAAALSALAASLGNSFTDAVNLILASKGRLVVGALGKSGHVGRKLAATFSSTGTRSVFLHLGEALHGDLGAIGPNDVTLLISHSGQTPELTPVIAFIREMALPLIAISANPRSMLMTAASAPILLPDWQEVCPQGLAPTTSTLMAMAVGDALAMAVMRDRGFGRPDFQRLHPAGALGQRLKPVSAMMRRDTEIPLVTPETPMLEAVIEMNEKRLGLVGVVDGEGLLVGVITDGDLRRNLERLPHATAGEVMTRDPKVVRPITLAEDAHAMLRHHKITALFVVEDPAERRPVGVVHIHDLAAGPGAI